jgi:hypothetical protein
VRCAEEGLSTSWDVKTLRSAGGLALVSAASVRDLRSTSELRAGAR